MMVPLDVPWEIDDVEGIDFYEDDGYDAKQVYSWGRSTQSEDTIVSDGETPLEAGWSEAGESGGNDSPNNESSEEDETLQMWKSTGLM